MVFSYALISCIISGLYVALILYILSQWQNLSNYSDRPSCDTDGDNPIVEPAHSISLSIIIPARNEADNIIPCLQSILQAIKYHEDIVKSSGIQNTLDLSTSLSPSSHSPVFVEIIVIDDHSDDDTAALVQAMQQRYAYLSLIKLSDINLDNKTTAYKKVALNKAIASAKGRYIIQLDADVKVPMPYILSLTKALHHTDADFVAAPVLFTSQDTFLGRFQTLDMMGMMALTAAGIETQNWYIANGANMIYKRELATLHSVSSMASGDDVFMIQAIAAEPRHRVIFLKSPNVIVTTQAEPHLAALYSQRIRWATKNKYMSSPKMQVMMLIPFIHALMLLIHLLVFWFVGPLALILLGFQLLTKLAVDYIYLLELATFFDQKKKLRLFALSAMGHIIYILIIGLMSLVVTKYEWKGRRVS